MHGDPLTAPDLWQYLLTVACAQRASDIHLEPTSTGLCCRLRIGGLLSQPAAVNAVAAAVDLGTRRHCAHTSRSTPAWISLKSGFPKTVASTL